MSADESPPLEPELADTLQRLVRIDEGTHETFRPMFDPNSRGMFFTSHALKEGGREIKPGMVKGLAD